MKEKFLYILAFKDEPLIKVGISNNVYFRSRALGEDRFDFSASYIIKCSVAHGVRTLERNLKTFFHDHQVVSVKPFQDSTGNTETFHSGILPSMIQSLHYLKDIFPQGRITIHEDISSIIPPETKPVRKREWVRTPFSKDGQTEIILDEMRSWCNAKHGRQVELAKAIGVPKQIIYHWMIGKTKPSWVQGSTLSEFLNSVNQKIAA